MSQIHIVDVATGRDRTVSDGPSLALLDFEPEGLYLTGVHWGAEGSAGLWRMNPATGALTQLYSTGEFVRIRNGIAWASASGFLNHQLIRRDLETGQESVWFEDPNGFVSLAGIDPSGAPLVAGANAPMSTGSRLIRVPALNTPELIASGTAFNGDFLARVVWSDDGNRTWLSADDGIYLLQSGRIEEVFAGPAVPAGVCF